MHIVRCFVPAVAALLLLPVLLPAQATPSVPLPQIAPSWSPFPEPPFAEPSPNVGSLPFVLDYEFFTPVYRNRDQNGVQRNVQFRPFLPYRFKPYANRPDTVEWRGYGQAFAPHALHAYLSGSVYNSSTDIYYDPASGFTDQDYIDQFREVGAYTIDSLQVFLYQNPLAAATKHGMVFTAHRSTYDFLSEDYRSLGFNKEMGTLPVVTRRLISAGALDSSSRNDSIFATRLAFTPSDSMRFAAGESAILLFVNDSTPAVSSNNVPPDADVQQTIYQLEWRFGSRADTIVGTPDTRTEPLDAYKSFGLVVYVDNEYAHFVRSIWHDLEFQGKPGIADLNLALWGTADLGAGLSVRFGPGANLATALSAPAPNPAITSTKIDFTIARPCAMRLDLFASDGRLVRSLIDGRMERGRYSYALELDRVTPGPYLVRLTADGQTSTQPLVVGR